MGCVVAGGRSTRMGRDKATLMLGGKSLLDRAVEVLARWCEPVVVAGAEHAAARGYVTVRDPVVDCGPMGGIGAALAYARDAGVSWTVFLPVDMPLLPAGLVGALVVRWRQQRDAWVCCAEADGRVQPLVSVVHTAVLPRLERSLTSGEYRLRPALEDAASELAAEYGTEPGNAFMRTRIESGLMQGAPKVDWLPSAAEWRRRALWFSNVNTPADLKAAEQAFTDGS